MAHEAASGSAFRPYVPPEQDIPEFTPKAIILGVFFGILFGAATVYLALRAGLTVSASVPIAVLSIAFFKKFGKSTILENNIVQTIGSAGESVAAGVVFTTPALIFLAGGDQYFKYIQITILAIFGGILGVLFMIPLRRALIVKEHGKLRYPEGVACADVLIAGEKGGNLAKMVFAGFWVALGYKILYGVFGLWRETATFFRTKKESIYPSSTLNVDVTPEYLGLGYIIGPKISGELFSGGLLSWMALIPLIAIFVPEPRLIADLEALGFSETWRANNSYANWIYRAYIRYIGAGAVACAGVMTLIKTMPTIVSAFRESLKSFGERAKAVAVKRTERDMSMGPVIFGSLAIVLILAILPGFPHGPFPGSLLMSLLIVIFGFFFVTVSSRIVGIIGTSSNPISGMTIATIMATCVIFVLVGWQRRRLPGRRAFGRSDRLHRGRERRRDVAGSEDRFPRRSDADSPAVRPRHRSPRVGPLHRRHALPPRLHTDLQGRPHGRARHRLAEARGAAGDAHGHDGQGPARAEPAVGARPRRRLPRLHGPARRRARALLGGRRVPARLDHGADLGRRHDEGAGRLDAEEEGGRRRKSRSSPRACSTRPASSPAARSAACSSRSSRLPATRS